MVHFFGKTNFDFIGPRWKMLTISAIIIVAGIISFAIRGANWSIDFRGGLDMQVLFARPVSDGQVRAALGGIEVGEVKTISSLGRPDEILIRLKVAENSEATQRQVMDKLGQVFPDNPAEIRNVDVVGPKVGQELRRQAIISAVVAIVLLLIYISWRFKFEYALGGIIALIHDVLVTLAFISFFHVEFSLAVLAAVLTLIGFSINDTIVVYDRIRENLKKLRQMKLSQIMNQSINETLSRTIITSLTVFLTVLVLFIFSGPVLRGFSFAMLVGVITGVYSSIFVAAPVVLEWAERKALQGKRR
ncbi:protein translocase subunit SecF [bacterium]|nr:protein translocase subunit SecF [bacterium]MBU1985301.1 protein translocase subunit SecF [bacterium]